MKISTKGRYALRLMTDLAIQGQGGQVPVSLKDIAARQGVSDKYLEQIIALLNKAGYVKSIRGPQGGYLLTETPSFYTAGMILRLTEGSLTPVACAEEERICEREGGCGTMELWKRLDDAIKEVVDGVTLAMLVEWQLAKQKDC